MVQESRVHEAEDKKRRELIEARNTADNLGYQLEKTLRELGDKVPSAERSNIESKINDLKQAAQSDDINRIKKATDDAQNAFHALSQQLYAQGQPQPEGQGQAAGRLLNRASRRQRRWRCDRRRSEGISL